MSTAADEALARAHPRAQLHHLGGSRAPIDVYDHVVWRVTHLCDVRDGDRVFEAGCGAGGFLDSVRRVHDGRIELAGVDAARAMVAVANRRLPDAKVVVAPATAYPAVADASCDVAVSSAFRRLATEAECRAALGELARVVRPGGRVLVAHARTRRADSERGGRDGHDRPTCPAGLAGLAVDAAWWADAARRTGLELVRVVPCAELYDAQWARDQEAGGRHCAYLRRPGQPAGPRVQPCRTFMTNRVGVGEHLEERGWTRVDDPLYVPAFCMWDTFGGDAQRFGRVRDLARAVVNPMSNKRAWAEALVDAGHADAMPDTLLTLRDARRAVRRADWSSAVYLKLATGVEGRGCSRWPDLEQAVRAWAVRDDPDLWVVQREVVPVPFGGDHKFVIRAFVLNAPDGAWYLHAAMYTKYAPIDTDVIMPGHTSFYGSLAEDFPDGYARCWPGVVAIVAAMGATFTHVGRAIQRGVVGCDALVHVHGLDIVTDADWTPRCIECNVYPALNVDPLGRPQRPDRRECRRMLDDLYAFVVLPVVDRTPAGPAGGWIRCWPEGAVTGPTKPTGPTGGGPTGPTGPTGPAVPAARTLAWQAGEVVRRAATQHDLH